MHYWQIGKYSPQEHEDRRKTPDWTSIYDIGRSYNGNVLTPEEYLSVEDKYVQAVVLFAEKPGVESMELFLFGRMSEDTSRKMIEQAPRCWPAELLEFYRSIHGDAVLSGKQIEYAARLGLREVFSALMRKKDELYVDLSYDFYMHLGSRVDDEEAIRQIKKSGLFVYPCRWPYEENVWKEGEAWLY
ncbi:hypothetical protein QWJ34_26340 [Saccharibacillus sp. CPCC 101409]|uniref:hypothetical protein n=1 Tax=Saccharibacillus sp. CPCC 101409 TaxID=3058041 RepID=UPI002671009E|nr:hypothetical protein [Saccharibacillus sp. CPCC 101409]MDO3413299.1 hypothetical protein [Saccharibacillus sp. CPCC 101409]